jgi:hypothetical protein
MHHRCITREAADPFTLGPEIRDGSKRVSSRVNCGLGAWLFEKATTIRGFAYVCLPTREDIVSEVIGEILGIVTDQNLAVGSYCSLEEAPVYNVGDVSTDVVANWSSWPRNDMDS